MEKAVLENPRKLEEARELAGLQELLPDKNQSPVTALSWYFVPQEANPFFRLNKITKMIDAAKDKGFTVEAKGSPNKGETWTADDLRKGLTKAIYGSILDESAEAGVFDPAKAYGKLFGKRGKAQNVSLAEWMKEKELISVEQLDNTEKLLAQLTQIQEFSAIADRKGGKLESLIDLSDISEPTKGLAAVIGSGAGAKMADAVGMRSSLVLQGRLTGGAVRAAQQILTKQPSSNTLEAIGAVLADKDLLAATLKMGDSLEENSSIFQEWVGTLVNNWVLAPVRRTAVSALQDGKPFDADERGEPAPPLQAPAPVAPAPAPVAQAGFALQTARHGLQGVAGSETYDTVAEVFVDEGDAAVAVNEARGGQPAGWFSFPGNVPIVIPAKSIVRLAAKAMSTGVAVTGGFSIMIQGSGSGTTVTSS